MEGDEGPSQGGAMTSPEWGNCGSKELCALQSGFPPISLSKNTLPLQLLLTIHYAEHSVKPLDEWQLKRSFTDFLKSSFSLTVPEDNIVVCRFKDLKKCKRDDPVAHGALFIRDLGFLSKFSRSEILHGIDREDDVKELEKKFLDWRRSVVGKTDGIELNLEGVKFRLTASVPESDDFGMRKEREELYAFFNRGLFLILSIVLNFLCLLVLLSTIMDSVI
ncbi:uncharacterized protein LOC114318774 [Camellia sinensis]|uniref:uncharacterized protein LOC114318774 n=1 Tax=Camellia sinensis TaxID=4442 RepID=UPI001036BEC9|nr:uncharacterized protein LOC114318774 [Camellia sinensis]